MGKGAESTHSGDYYQVSLCTSKKSVENNETMAIPLEQKKSTFKTLSGLWTSNQHDGSALIHLINETVSLYLVLGTLHGAVYMMVNQIDSDVENLTEIIFLHLKG